MCWKTRWISRRRHTKRHVKQLTKQRRRLELSDRQVATVEVHERRQGAGGNKTRKGQNHQETGHWKDWNCGTLAETWKKNKLQTTFAFAAYWRRFVASLIYISCKLYQMSSSWDSDKRKNCMIGSNLGLSVVSSAWIAAQTQGWISSGSHSQVLDALCSSQVWRKWGKQ